MRIGEFLGGLFGKKRALRGGYSETAEHPTQPLTPADRARQEKLRQDATKHEGILNQEFAKALERADEGVSFPDSPADPLAYLGNLDPLGLSSEERNVVRDWTRELVEERGERAVWNSRLRLKLELRYLASESGLHKGIGRFPGERG